MRLFRRFSTAVVTTLALTASAFAGGAADRLLSIVPADAASVGMVKVDAMKSSPLTARLFSEADKVSVDGEAERFFRETGLNLTQDVDTLVFAMSPRDNGTKADVLVAAAGRFDVAKLSAAAADRGAVKKMFGDRAYFTGGESSKSDDTAAVAFYDKNLVLAGTEDAVTGALSNLAKGGSRFTAASGLAHELGRIDRAADCWVLLDVQRAARMAHTPKGPSSSPVTPASLGVAIKRVSTFAMWANASDDSLAFGASAVSNDSETRAMIEDMLRGLTATWRMAAQEKHPELVSIIRGFDIENGRDAVSIEGKIPAEFLKNFAKKVEQHASK